jgi:hypothetical protein
VTVICDAEELMGGGSECGVRLLNSSLGTGPMFDCFCTQCSAWPSSNGLHTWATECQLLLLMAILCLRCTDMDHHARDAIMCQMYTGITRDLDRANTAAEYNDCTDR